MITTKAAIWMVVAHPGGIGILVVMTYTKNPMSETTRTKMIRSTGLPLPALSH